MNDLYEAKNLYLVINNLRGLAQKLGFKGAVIGSQVVGQPHNFGTSYGSNKGASQAGMTARGNIKMHDAQGVSVGRGANQSTIPLRSGSNQGASQKGMTAYGTGRDITMGHAQGLGIGVNQSTVSLQYGSNKGASQAGMTAYGAGRDIKMHDAQGITVGRGADQSTIPLRSGSNQGASQKGMTAYGTGRQIVDERRINP